MLSAQQRVDLGMRPRRPRAGSRRGAAGPALPCLSSNNSDRDPVGHPAFEQSKRTNWLTPAQKKTAHALTANIEFLVETSGLDRMAFLTITFAEDLTWKEAERRYNNFARRVLPALFPGGRIKVLEFTRAGRPHFHLVVVCQGDVRTGFNFDHLEAVEQWGHHKLGKEGIPKPRGDYNATLLLRSLWAKLNEAAPKYGLGSIIQLVPIKSNATAIGHYVGGYISKSLGGRKPEHKGARMVSYSRGFERLYRGNFSHVERGRDYRRRLAIWAGRRGFGSLDDISKALGPCWFYHHQAEIFGIPLSEHETQPTPTPTQPSHPASETSRAGDDCPPEDACPAGKPARENACPGDVHANGGGDSRGDFALDQRGGLRVSTLDVGTGDDTSTHRDSGQVKRGAPPPVTPRRRVATGGPK